MNRLLKSSIALALCLAPIPFAHSENVVDCSKGASLQQAINFAPANSSIFVQGVCSGPITITTDGLRIIATGSGGQINGNGKDAVTVDGAQRVLLQKLFITGGNNGVVVDRGGQATLQNDHISGNAFIGILVQAHSSATLGDGSDQNNGFDGIDVESTSALTITGLYSITQNGVFGIDINNGSSLTLTGAHLSVQQNTLGVQLGTNASGFLDGQSTLDASSNFTVGLTMVSGSHMVDFGGAILTNENGNNGLSLNSKAGLDLDAGAAVTSSGNAGDGVHLEQLSVMTVFNNPQFSGSNAATQLLTRGNRGDGVNLLTGSEMLVDNYASLVSISNAKAGLALDDGSSISFGQTIPVSGVQSKINGNLIDTTLYFGSRLTALPNVNFGTFACDKTVLVRGTNAILCP